MNRRRFLHLLTTAAAAVAVSPYWTPTPELVEPPAPPPVYSGDPWLRMIDPKAGVSMHVIRRYDAVYQVNRIDVLYGFGILTGHENIAIRVLSPSGEGTGARARRRQKRQQVTPTIKIFPPIYDDTFSKGTTV